MNQPWMEQALTQLQTPFYLFDTDAAAAQVEALRKKLPDRVGLCYAVKAKPLPDPGSGAGGRARL